MADPTLDLLPQREVARRIGRTIDTLRKWRRDGLIEAVRDPSSASAPVLMSLRQAQLVAAKKAGRARPPKQDTQQQPVQAHPPPDLRHIASLQDRIGDLMKQRDGLQAELGRVRTELDKARSEGFDLQRRADALALELKTVEGSHGGLVRGLLSAGRKRFGL